MRIDDWKDRKSPELDLKNLVAGLGINNDEVDDMADKKALHLNDGLANIKDTADDRVQHKQDNQHNHFGGPIENEEQQNHFGAHSQDNKLQKHFGAPNQDNKLLDPIVNFDNKDDDDDDDKANVVPEDSDSTNSGTHDYYDTSDEHEGYQSKEDSDSDYEPSDQEDNMDNQSPLIVNQALRKLKSNLDGDH